MLHGCWSSLLPGLDHRSPWPRKPATVDVNGVLFAEKPGPKSVTQYSAFSGSRMRVHPPSRSAGAAAAAARKVLLCVQSTRRARRLVSVVTPPSQRKTTQIVKRAACSR
jgi:hypothetical protein